MPHPTPMAEPESTPWTLPQRLLVDAHVHYHACFDPDRFFESAQRNFGRALTPRIGAESFLGCLLFTESRADHFFDEFRSRAGCPMRSRWSIHPTEEDESLFVKGPDPAQLLVVAGRQIVTAENLEILALGTTLDFEDGSPLRTVLPRVLENDAIAVLPWGFGKWWFQRGEFLESLIAEGIGGPVFLGDNAGRPRVSRRPPAFRRGEAQGWFVLPGSDPLPFPHQADRAGRYGFFMDVPLDPRRPAQSLKAALRGLEATPPSFGKLESLTGFFRSQISMQVRKRMR